MNQHKTSHDREILVSAQQSGTISTLGAFFRLSGPGWLQSAITLGGGSLGGALYLGLLGGTTMLWLQLVAILIGVIMLSAIGYVTLSTGRRPYQAINQYINPVLGVGWITATMLANMIWMMPQYSLCFDALDSNLTFLPVKDTQFWQVLISILLAVSALSIVVLSFNPGWTSRLFDLMLKIMVGVIVICFVLSAIYLFNEGAVDAGEVFRGFIPNLYQWNQVSPGIELLLKELPADIQQSWRAELVGKQQSTMISVMATAVGINMTFLLPYSMLARGWDKPFRGLAQFDLVAAMAIPFIIVTSCIVIAAAHAFHAKADPDFLSNDAAIVQKSKFFKGAKKSILARFQLVQGDDAYAELQKLPADQQTLRLAQFTTSLDVAERKLAATLVKPNAQQLAASLAGLLGERVANLVFGLGALAMGFSTMIILALINGYAFAEVMGKYESLVARSVGALMAIAVGFCWFWFWENESKTWLIIVAGTFGAIFLPIAYLSFFALMNNRALLGDDKPVGWKMIVWNVLLIVGVLVAAAQAWGATTVQLAKPATGSFVLGGLVTFLMLAIVGFSARTRRSK